MHAAATITTTATSTSKNCTLSIQFRNCNNEIVSLRFIYLETGLKCSIICILFLSIASANEHGRNHIWNDEIWRNFYVCSKAECAHRSCAMAIGNSQIMPTILPFEVEWRMCLLKVKPIGLRQAMISSFNLLMNNYKSVRRMVCGRPIGCIVLQQTC